jgi:hypothetical protein
MSVGFLFQGCRGIFHKPRRKRLEIEESPFFLQLHHFAQPNSGPNAAGIARCISPIYNDVMRRPPLSIAVLVLTILLIDLVVVWMLASHVITYRIWDFFAISVVSSLVRQSIVALFLSQIAALGVWLGVGRSPLPFRAVIAFLIWLEWISFVLYSETENLKCYPGQGAIVFSVFVVLLLSVPLLILRLFKLCLVNKLQDSSASIDEESKHPMQFSLLFMFGLMTGVAVILGMFQFCYLKQPFVDSFYKIYGNSGFIVADGL